jgi:hypothetical protein
LVLRPERLSKKLERLFSPTLSEEHFETVIISFQALMAHGDGFTPTSTPGESSTSLVHPDPNNTAMSPGAEPSQMSTFSEVLSESGMTGMVQWYLRLFGERPDPEKMKRITGHIGDLLSLVMSQ